MSKFLPITLFLLMLQTSAIAGVSVAYDTALASVDGNALSEVYTDFTSSDHREHHGEFTGDSYADFSAEWSDLDGVSVNFALSEGTFRWPERFNESGERVKDDDCEGRRFLSLLRPV